MDVGNLSFPPASNLVAKEPKASRPSRSNRTFRYDTSLFAVEVGNGRLLDHKPTLRNIDYQSRVVEVAASSSVSEGRACLEQLAAHPDDVRSSAQWDPVEVHGTALLAHVEASVGLPQVTTHDRS
jgi:hypothetical protein